MSIEYVVDKQGVLWRVGDKYHLTPEEEKNHAPSCYVKNIELRDTGTTVEVFIAKNGTKKTLYKAIFESRIIMYKN